MYSGREIDLIGVFSAFLLNDYGLGNHFIEVVHGKTGEDFLVDELHLFCVKMLETDRVFQLAKRSLNAPPHCIQFLELGGRKRSGIQIGKNRLERCIRNRETNNAEGQIVEDNRIVFSGTPWKIVKPDRLANELIVVLIFQ